MSSTSPVNIYIYKHREHAEKEVKTRATENRPRLIYPHTVHTAVLVNPCQVLFVVI